jgi:DNA-binding MarR family transcriptional regulator
MNRIQKEQYIFGTIFLLANQLQIQGDKLTSDLTLKQWLVLLMLYKMKTKNPSINKLAEAIGVSRQSMKKMISLLEDKGFIAIKKSLEDHRALYIQPTPQAHDFFKRNKELGEIFLESLFKDITADELDTVSEVFKKLFNKLSQKSSIKGEEHTNEIIR